MNPSSTLMRYRMLIIITAAVLILGTGLSLIRQRVSQPSYQIDKDATLLIAKGYGGDIPLAVTTSPNGQLVSIKALKHNETPSYVATLDIFLQQFIGRDKRTPLILGKNIDGITGASVTSSGITRAVQQYLNPALAVKTNPINFVPILTALLLTALAITALLMKSTWLRWSALLGGFIFFGLIERSMLSIVGVISVISLNSPPLDVSTMLLTTLAVGFIPPLILGRIYCGSLCPFALVHEITAKVLPVKWRPKRISVPTDTKAKQIKYVMAIALIVLCVLLRSTAPANIEPYITLFSVKAAWPAWLFCGAMILIGVFYSRFWCVYLCPAGALTGLASTFSLFKLKASGECATNCQGCANICPVQAIAPNDKNTFDIDAAECILCGECLKGCKNSCFELEYAYGKTNK